MTKELSAEIRAMVRSRAWRAARDIAMGELPFPTADQLMVGKPTMNELATQQMFNSGAKWLAEFVESLGRLPKAQQVKPKTRHLKLED